MEKAASSILVRAVALDGARRFTEALVCYQEGLELLMEIYKGVPQGTKKQEMKEKIELYVGRAEQIKKVVNEKKESGNYHEEITISDGSCGHSYEAVMGRFMNAHVENIQIEDPYIRSYNQFCNLVHFCELAVKKCDNLKTINLITNCDRDNEEQYNLFKSLSLDLLKNHRIMFSIKYSQTLHDRKIIFSNGWIVKIGRGLDYFKPPLIKNGLGKFDLNFRPCKETKIDIYHQNNMLQK